MSDFDTEVTVKYPERNNFDSDRGNYFNKISEKTLRDNYFGCRKEDEDYYKEDKYFG